MAPFYGWGSAEPLWGDSLLFTIQFPVVPATQMIGGGRWKAELILEPPSGFYPGHLNWKVSALTTKLLWH